MTKDVSISVSTRLRVIGNENLPSDFTINNGLRCHLVFDNESHPAEVRQCDKPLSIGEVGNEIVLMFIALEKERDSIVEGLRFELLGGMTKFAEGVVQRVLNIDEIESGK